MASIRLGIYEVEEYELPKVCMRCGVKAVGYQRRRFRWSPPWALIGIPFGLFPYFLISELTMKRVTMRVPYCEEHWKRPLWPTLVSVGTLGGLVVMTVGLLVVFNGEGGAVPGIFCLGVLGFFVWAFASVILHTPPIRPTEITDQSVTLKGVSEGFIDALKEARRGYDDPDEEDDRPRRRRRDEGEGGRPSRRGADDDGGYYDPDARRRRRRGDDDEDDR